MPCPDINHMRHASISHHVPRDDHVGRIHLFLLASREGEVATVPSNVGTTSLCPLFSSSFGFFVFLSPEPPEIPHDSGELPWPCAEQSNHSRYQPPECFHLSEEEGGKTTSTFFRHFSRLKNQKKKAPVTKKPWDRRKLQKLRVLPATFPASKRPIPGGQASIAFLNTVVL